MIIKTRIGRSRCQQDPVRLWEGKVAVALSPPDEDGRQHPTQPCPQSSALCRCHAIHTYPSSASSLLVTWLFLRPPPQQSSGAGQVELAISFSWSSNCRYQAGSRSIWPQAAEKQSIPALLMSPAFHLHGPKAVS